MGLGDFPLLHGPSTLGFEKNLKDEAFCEFLEAIAVDP